MNTPTAPVLASALTALIGLVVLAPRSALAAPPQDLPLSNEAAMMGGAVRAAGRSAGSFWYNPALLGRIHLSETEANGEVVGARWTQAPNVVTLALPSGERIDTSLSDAQFVAVPTTFAGAIAVTPKLTVGYGLFQPVASQFAAVADVVDTSEVEGETVFQLRNFQGAERYSLGAGLGYAVSDNFQLGGSLFAVIDQIQSDQQLFLVRSDVTNDVATSALVDEVAAIGAFGLTAAFGVRGRLGRIVHAAANVRSPSFVLTQWIDGMQTVSEVGPDGAETEVEPLALDRWQQTQLSGWELSTGLSVGPGDWLLNLDLTADTGTRPRTGSLSAGPSFGARLGGSARINERVLIGAGAFYDSPGGNDDELGALSLHRVGGSLGIEMTRRLELANRNSIEFRNVVAAWYAYGFGTMAGLEVTPGPSQALLVTALTQVPARSHLIVLHIGSTLAF